MQFGWLARPHSVVSRPSTRILTLEMAILMGITAGRKTPRALSCTRRFVWLDNLIKALMKARVVACGGEYELYMRWWKINQSLKFLKIFEYIVARTFVSGNIFYDRSELKWKFRCKVRSNNWSWLYSSTRRFELLFDYSSSASLWLYRFLQIGPFRRRRGQSN